MRHDCCVVLAPALAHSLADSLADSPTHPLARVFHRLFRWEEQPWSALRQVTDPYVFLNRRVDRGRSSPSLCRHSTSLLTAASSLDCRYLKLFSGLVRELISNPPTTGWESLAHSFARSLARSTTRSGPPATGHHRFVVVHVHPSAERDIGAPSKRGIAPLPSPCLLLPCVLTRRRSDAPLRCELHSSLIVNCLSSPISIL